MIILERNKKINFGRKPKILAVKQIFLKETQTKILEGKQNRILEGNQKNWKRNFDTCRPS